MEEAIIQVKYCYSEEELNEFLKTLHTDAALAPRLHNIQYLPNVNGEGDDSKVSISNSVIAIVQYWTKKEKSVKDIIEEVSKKGK